MCCYKNICNHFHKYLDHVVIFKYVFGFLIYFHCEVMAGSDAFFPLSEHVIICVKIIRTPQLDLTWIAETERIIILFLFFLAS